MPARVDRPPVCEMSTASTRRTGAGRCRARASRSGRGASVSRRACSRALAAAMSTSRFSSGERGATMRTGPPRRSARVSSMARRLMSVAAKEGRGAGGDAAASDTAAEVTAPGACGPFAPCDSAASANVAASVDTDNPVPVRGPPGAACGTGVPASTPRSGLSGSSVSSGPSAPSGPSTPSVTGSHGTTMREGMAECGP